MSHWFEGGIPYHGFSGSPWPTLVLIGLAALALLVVVWVLSNDRRRTEDVVREAQVDVQEDGEETILFAELPGVNENEIAVAIRDETVILDTTGKRKYRTVVPLSEPVETTPWRQSYKNGLLELHLKKLGAAA